MKKKEIEGPSELNLFVAKHFNVQVATALHTDGWAGAEHWDLAADEEITLDYLLGRCEVATIGIDGGGLDDLFGIAVIGREEKTKRWLCWAHAFISPVGVERRKANESAYNGFIEDDDLTLVEQLPDDLVGISEIVKKVKDAGILDRVGVDAAGIGGTVDVLDEHGISPELGNLGGIRQGIGLMGAIKTIERKLVDKSFVHSGSRLMNWCVGNAKIVATSTAIRIARDESGFGKIDPLMAVFNAVDLMSANPKSKRSVYEKRGFRHIDHGA
jgi:phage terminase large subunit-like protein